jgi:hypothetical protein
MTAKRLKSYLKEFFKCLFIVDTGLKNELTKYYIIKEKQIETG